MSDRELSRRTVLKGLGTVAIGLPLMEEMLVSPSVAKPEDPPVRAFNIFFGLGVPAPLQQEGYSGVLEPLAPLRDKLLLLREVDHTRADESGINAHYDGSTAAFTAEPPNGTAKAGGASIDQMVRKAHYPNGLPEGVISTLIAGTFFRRDRPSRHSHSWNEDGSVAARIRETPKELFDRLFGTPDDEREENARRDRLERSVLDSVVEQYNDYTGPNSPLGAKSKRRLAQHLDRIREYERRAYGMESDVRCKKPSRPNNSSIPHGDPADPSGEGIDITYDALSSEWELMADLYALAIKCDLARFGTITFLSAGERIRLTGQYEYDGNLVYEFDDPGELGASGAKGCSHEWWHKFDPNAQNEQLRAHAHMKMRQIAYFLKQLDGPDAIEANGNSILENSLITISTEAGDGRHSDPMRELSGVFHAVTGANGRFETGRIVDVGAEGLDVYNTILDGMGVSDHLGPSDREMQSIDTIRA